MTDKIRLNIDDMLVVKTFAIGSKQAPQAVIVGLVHIAGRAARLGVPNPKEKRTDFVFSPEVATHLAEELLKAAKEARSPATH